MEESFEWIKENELFYNHWSPEWNYKKSKEELIEILEKSYANFLNISPQTTELYLLLGTISHYLYNLDKTNYHKTALEYFSKAIANNAKEFRAYWFLGYHFSLSNNSTEAITNFLIAKTLLPKEEPIDFWENFAFAAAVANMPSHSIFAMERVQEITGTMGYLESQLGENIRKQIKSIDKTKDYKKEDIWYGSKGELVTFISRPLGIKILVDSTWNLSLYDHNNGISAFIINPNPIANDKGLEINYTIAIIIKTAETQDNLEDYINKFISNYPVKEKIKLFDNYEKMIVYEMKDKAMYEEIGGGHLYMVGIERNNPKNPGLLLERPVNLPQENSENLIFYCPTGSFNRFEGKIFYAIMLDSCEDIHDKSFSVFKEFIDKYLVIE
jgi:tetratricopeptide (TPR) repeat protein